MEWKNQNAYRKKTSPNLAYGVSLSMRLKMTRLREIWASIYLALVFQALFWGFYLFQLKPYKHWEIRTIIIPIL